MLLVVVALLAPGGGWTSGSSRRSSSLWPPTRHSSRCATRCVAPPTASNQLAEFRDEIAGQPVLALTSDRFTDYGLRTARSRARRSTRRSASGRRASKTQRLPIDFDSVPASVLNEFPYAVTTSASTRARRRPAGRWPTRTGHTSSGSGLGRRHRSAVRRGGASGTDLPLQATESSRRFLDYGGELLTWRPRPVIAKRLYWKADGSSGVVLEGGQIDNNLSPGETASQQIDPAAGRWQLSIQYVSPVTGIEVERPGAEPCSCPPAWTRRSPTDPIRGPTGRSAR